MEERRLHDFLPELKDYYTVNTNGEFFSDNCGKMKTRNRAGTDYQIINFSTVDNKKRTFRAHRLVMMAFKPVENMENLQVNHIDGNKQNNKLDNLEWCTPSENQKHAFKMGLQKARTGEKSNLSKLTEQDVKKVFELMSQGLTQKEIGNILGCSDSNISAILRGKSWKQVNSSTTIPEGSTSK